MIVAAAAIVAGFAGLTAARGDDGLPLRASAFAEATSPPTFSRYLSPAEFAAAARIAGWPDDQIPALRSLVECETQGTFDTQAYNPEDPNGGSHGLTQLNGDQHFIAADEDFDRRHDPVTNLRVARWLYEWRGRYGGTGGWMICAERLGLY